MGVKYIAFYKLTFAVPPMCGFTERLTFLVHNTRLRVRKWGASVPIPGVVSWHWRNTCLLSMLGGLTHWIFCIQQSALLETRTLVRWYGFVIGSCGYKGSKYCRKNPQSLLPVFFFCNDCCHSHWSTKKESILMLILKCISLFELL